MSEKTRVSIILASTSPRRRQLLSEWGYKFRVVEPEIDESAFETEDVSPCEYASKLALAKAKSVAGKFADSFVIGADTVGDFEGRIIGKPADAEDAERITRMLFGSPHRVITAVAIVRVKDNIEIIKSDVTTVYPKRISEQQIAEHIKGRSWEGKAGAYAIQETGDEFVERLEGSLTNVMGFPMELLGRMLSSVGCAI
ncbi:MAG: Maf family protein [Planctomycetota bacterium]|jgi:septum formation protein